MLYLFYWCLRNMANGECVVIVESSIISPSNTGIPFLDLMTCMGPLYFLKLMSKVVITKSESNRVISGKLLLRPNLDYMSG